MSTGVLQERLTRVRAAAEGRLDNVASLLPEMRQRERVHFEDYVSRAAVVAQRDPAFREKFEAAMRQYQAAGAAVRAQHGST